MLRRLFILVVVWLIFATPPPIQAAVDVSAQVDRTIISPGESVQMQVKVSDGRGEVDLSPIADFKVRSLGTSSNVHFINGQLTKEVSYSYLLMPRGKGKLTIPPLTVTVDGEIYRTNPIAITVSDRPNVETSGQSEGEDVWVIAEISDREPFSGQQITYTLRFFRGVPMDKARFNAPAFKGFSTNDVEERYAYRKVINGREYAVTEVYIILTPLQAGEWTIDPAVVNVGVIRRRQGRPRSPFEDFFNRGILEPRVLQTKPIKISVRPLPPLPPPQEFSGLVGRFDMKAVTESTQLAVGDSATLTITLTGTGNISNAQLPELILPTAFKSYADHPEDEVVVDRNGVSGKRVFRTALVPVEPGRYTLDPIELTYFDVDKKAYHTLRAQLPRLTVVPEADPNSEALTVTPGTLPLFKKKVAFTGRDILPPKESLAAIQPRTPLGWPFFLILLAAPVSIYGLVMLTQRLRRPDTSATAIMKARARKALKRARASKSETSMTWLYQALTAAILSASGRMGEALTWKEAETLLLENHFSEEEASGAAKLLTEIESIKFGGMKLTEERRGILLDQTRTMVRKLAP